MSQIDYHEKECKDNKIRKVSTVAFAGQLEEAKDKEIYDMIDEVIYMLYGTTGLAAIIKPGYKVVIKVNLVGPTQGQRGEEGRGVITDPRIVRYVAEKVRSIIGFNGTADLKVVDGIFYKETNPSMVSAKTSFHWGRLERTGDSCIDEEDFCYDYNADGILDGTSKAQLVNLDSIAEEERIEYSVKVNSGNTVKVAFPKFLRKKKEANGEDDYCDVFIGLPIFKSSSILGMTGAIKLHYGIRSLFGIYEDTGRWGHEGVYYHEDGTIENIDNLCDYLCAQHLVRSYDLIIMDCLTANRKGPAGPLNQVSYSIDSTNKVDYILTNSILASTDVVAIDTVETAFAGYKQDTVKLLQVAAENNIGINDPSHIILTGFNYFSILRGHVWDKYHNINKYPLENKWGGAEVLESVTPSYIVSCSEDKEEKKKDGLCHIIYKITPKEGVVNIPLSRIELIVNGKLIKYKTRRLALSGEFIFDPSKITCYNGTYVVAIVNVWDITFNCVRSLECFIKPEH